MQAKGRRSPRVTADPGRISPSSSSSVRMVFECQVLEALADGRARVMTSAGKLIDCRVARGIDMSWVKAALAFGPVDGEGTQGERGGSLWAVFPGPEHAAAVAETVTLAASERLDLVCGESTVTLKADGRIRVRGRDVATRGSRVTRVQGRTVRIN